MTKCRERLNSQGGDWTLHSIDMALFSYYILREHKPDMLKDLPDESEVVTNNGSNGHSVDQEGETKSETANDGEETKDNESDPEPEKKEDNEQVPEPEKSKSPGGAKRSLEEDEDSNQSDSKRAREETDNCVSNGASVTNGGQEALETNGDNVDQNGDTNSPHKANISGHLLVC